MFKRRAAGRPRRSPPSTPTTRSTAGGTRSPPSSPRSTRSPRARPRSSTPSDRDQAQADLAATEPGFEFTVEAKAVNLTWQNLDAGAVNYYLMDVELLFSRNPFVQQSGGQFSPHPAERRSRRSTLPKDKPNPFDVPAAGRAQDQRTCWSRSTAAGKTQPRAYYANSLDVQTIENYGQVQVTRRRRRQAAAEGVREGVRPAWRTASVKFHKDGYTDLRGRFDYASVSTNELEQVERFALLVLSDDHGAVIREAAPPHQ